MVVNHPLTLDGLSELARSDNTEHARSNACCACTHYLVFKEPEDGSPSPARRVPTDRTISSVLGEPFEVTSPTVGCQQLSFHARSPRQMLRDDDSGKAFHLKWPGHFARQTGVQQANLPILRITARLVNLLQRDLLQREPGSCPSFLFAPQNSAHESPGPGGGAPSR